MNIEGQQKSGSLSSNDQQLNNNNTQNPQKKNLNRLFRINFSILSKKHPENQEHENQNKKLTFRQRFNSLRRSFHLGNRNLFYKDKNHLLSNE